MVHNCLLNILYEILWMIHICLLNIFIWNTMSYTYLSCKHYMKYYEWYNHICRVNIFLWIIHICRVSIFISNTITRTKEWCILVWRSRWIVFVWGYFVCLEDKWNISTQKQWTWSPDLDTSWTGSCFYPIQLLMILMYNVQF